MASKLQPIKQYATDTNLDANWSKPFPVNGQGIVVFNIERNNPFAIAVVNEFKVQDEDWIALDVQVDSASFNMTLNGKQSTLVTEKNTTTKNVGYETEKKISYWYSYDRDNLVLKYGKGYRMEETTLMTHDFLKGLTPEQQKDKREELENLFNPEVKKIVQQYDIPPPPTPPKSTYQQPRKSLQSGESAAKRRRLTAEEDPESQSLVDIEGLVEFDVNPLFSNRPFLVKDSSENNLFLLDEGNYTFSASLPYSARILYENVKNCELNWPEEVDDVLLSDAIRYSINTKGCALYDMLDSKKDEFGGPDESYLRVTLGSSFGMSPGIPYVLEIWPSGHYSPIHNHGNANAVIKVLFGTIHVEIYNKHLYGSPKPLLEFDGKAGDFTWLDRNWYQTHKLTNKSDDFCATIQCYNYEVIDTTHWPYFDYLADVNRIDEFYPESDFTFREMRDQVMKEYKASLTAPPSAKKSIGYQQTTNKRGVGYWKR